MTQSKKYYQAYDERYRQVHEQSLQWSSLSPSPIVSKILEIYHISKNDPILEIGCGEGRDAVCLLQNGYPLLATDISAEAISYCRKHYSEHADSFRILDCLTERLPEKYDFIYAIAVLHMLTEDSDRSRFYRFLHDHLKEKGIALICTMGNGTEEWQTDSSQAFELQKRVHQQSGKEIFIAATSCRKVSFETLKQETAAEFLTILESGMTSIPPDFPGIMYAVIKRAPVSSL